MKISPTINSLQRQIKEILELWVHRRMTEMDLYQMLATVVLFMSTKRNWVFTLPRLLRCTWSKMMCSSRQIDHVQRMWCSLQLNKSQTSITVSSPPWCLGGFIVFHNLPWKAINSTLACDVRPILFSDWSIIWDYFNLLLHSVW